MTELLKEKPLHLLSDRMKQQIAFVLEIDKLKTILRRSPLLDGSRRENDAEHSWHVAMMVMIFGEYAAKGVDLNRVMKMLLLHDLIEIDAGDTFLYDESAFADSKQEREREAAERLYGLLPEDLGKELKALWQEFDDKQTEDARFAAALDRLQPMMHNFFGGGGTWAEYQVSVQQVLAKKTFIGEVSPELWQFAEGMIQGAIERGYLKKA